MESESTLELIAKELRETASAASGNPAVVYIRAVTLLEYAEAIEKHLREPRFGVGP